MSRAHFTIYVVVICEHCPHVNAVTHWTCHFRPPQKRFFLDLCITLRMYGFYVVAISRNLHQHYLKLENNCCISLEDRLHPAAVLWLSGRGISTITRQYFKSYGSIRIQRSMPCSTGDDPGTRRQDRTTQVQQVVGGRLMTI